VPLPLYPQAEKVAIVRLHRLEASFQLRDGRTLTDNADLLRVTREKLSDAMPRNRLIIELSCDSRTR
jgi:hypothetical protein